METNDEYLDRICSNKPKKQKRKAKAEEAKSFFGYSWDDIQAMQRKTYKPRIIK